MSGFAKGLILGGILVFVFLAIIGIWINNPTPTGNVINVPKTEQTIIDKEESIQQNMNYYQVFEVYENAKISTNLTSKEPIDYNLLPDYEVDHYMNGESFKSYANSKGILHLEESYNLSPGKYAVMITNGDKPVNFHLIVKALEI